MELNLIMLPSSSHDVEERAPGYRHTFPVSNIGVLTNGRGPSAHCLVDRCCCVVAILKAVARDVPLWNTLAAVIASETTVT